MSKTAEERMAMCEESITAAHAEVNSLHTTLEKKGINSRGTADVFGRVFEVPVDKEHKATQLPFTKCGNPHMRAFHSSWFAFFCTFFSTFAAAPLISTIKKEQNLNLSRKDISAANSASVSGTIIMRLLTGYIVRAALARPPLGARP
jgi:NNP family nitrate/nitrite transporter-like MFS transporter